MSGSSANITAAAGAPVGNCSAAGAWHRHHKPGPLVLWRDEHLEKDCDRRSGILAGSKLVDRNEHFNCRPSGKRREAEPRSISAVRRARRRRRRGHRRHGLRLARRDRSIFRRTRSPGQNLFFCTTSGTPGVWTQMTGAMAGAGAPGGNCTPPVVYVDTTNQELWFCGAANSWKKPAGDSSSLGTLAGANTWSGYNNFANAQWRPPEATVANLPARRRNRQGVHGDRCGKRRELCFGRRFGARIMPGGGDADTSASAAAAA